MHDWIRKLKAETDKGGVLMYDTDILRQPKWRINRHTISVHAGNCGFILLERGEDPKEVERELRPRLKLFREVQC